MISIIICGRGQSINPDLNKNIKETVGVEFEIVHIDNSSNKYNIFQAYNEGVRRAQYDCLCFVHDDVRFHTPNWGLTVINHLSNRKVGMIGVAGPTFMSRIPGIWWGIDSPLCRTNSIRQRNLDTNRDNLKQTEMRSINPLKELTSEVVAVDGVFFCILKERFNKIRFDETYGGYHFYDMDISMQVRMCNLQILCVYDILIEHISKPNLSKEWAWVARRFFDKWHNQLPQSSTVYSRKMVSKMERNTIHTMVNILGSVSISPVKYYNKMEWRYILLHHPLYCIKKLIHKVC